MNKKICTSLFGLLAAAVIMGGATPSYAETTTPSSNTVFNESQIVEENDPAFVPGDYLYFIKSMMEKIELALTFDDLEKAHLLAEYTQERIKEANSLIQHGNTELAVETLNKSLENQELAVEYSGLSSETEQGATDQPNTEKNKELATIFKQNMDALILSLEKVDNLKAQKALAHNIEKSFDKLSKATEQLDKADQKYEEKFAEVTKKQESGQISVEEATREKDKLNREYELKKSKINREFQQKLDKISNETQKEEKVKKEEDEKAKEQRKQVEEKLKEERKKAEEKEKEEKKKAEEKEANKE